MSVSRQEPAATCAPTPAAYAAEGLTGASGAQRAIRKRRRVETPKAAPEYAFRLFIAGLTPCSQAAIDRLNEYCARHLHGRHRIEVVDLYQSPELAAIEQIVATPTLIRLLPEPKRRQVGDLSHEDRFLSGLEIPQRPA